MFRRQREAWLSSALVRLIVRARDRRSWTVRCRDERGRNATAVVALTEEFVTVESADHGTIHLSSAQVDCLRVALRAAVLRLDEVDEDDAGTGPAHAIPVQRSHGLPREVDHPNG